MTPASPDAPREWTPSMPLRSDATDYQIALRSAFLCSDNPSVDRLRTVRGLVCHEYAEARVADVGAREYVRGREHQIAAAEEQKKAFRAPPPAPASGDERARLIDLLRTGWHRWNLTEHVAIERMADDVLAWMRERATPDTETPVAVDPRVDPLTEAEISGVFTYTSYEYARLYGKDAKTVRAVVIARALAGGSDA